MRERPRRSQKVRHYQFTKQKDLGESIIYSFARCVAGQSTDMIVTYSLITYLLISILSSSLKSRRRRTKVAQTSLPYTQQPAWRPRFSISLKGSPHFNLQSIPSPAISSPLARSEETTIKNESDIRSYNDNNHCHVPSLSPPEASSSEQHLPDPTLHPLQRGTDRRFEDSENPASEKIYERRSFDRPSVLSGASQFGWGR